ncbi:RHS repeat protein [Escherichia coli]
MWRRERDLTGWMSLSRNSQVTWYGWDGDRLTTIPTTGAASRRFISRGASHHSSELKLPPVNWPERSAAAWRMRLIQQRRWQCGVPAGAGADTEPAGK